MATGAPPFGALYSDLYDAPFPSSPLGSMVELYLGPVLGWTDISRFVYQRTPISITDGRPDESSEINPSSCSLTLDDRDHRFSINNPVGPYWGLLTRNTPMRVSVPTSQLPAPYNTSYLRIESDNTSYAAAATVPQLQITGSIDIRIDVDLSDYQGRFLASIWGGSWNFDTVNSGRLSFQYTPDGVTTVTQESSPGITIPVGRHVYRCTFDATTGNVAFYYAAPGNIDVGPWTQIGTTQAGSGATGLHVSTAPLQVGQFFGAIYDFELRNGIGGTVVARPAFHTLAAGTTSWTDSAGLSWSLAGTAEISARSYRYHGELSDTPKASDPTGTDISIAATASGILRRLQQAQSPINSPLYRAYARLTGSIAPVAYWPCEDQGAATQIASALPGGSPMNVSGMPQFAADSSFACSAPIPAVNNSAWTGNVPRAAVTWSANVVRFLLDVPASGDTNNAVVARVLTGGTVARMDVVYTTGSGGELALNCYDSASSLLGSVGPIPFVLASGAFGGCNGAPMRVDVNLQIVSGSIQASIGGYVIGAPSADGLTTSFAGSIGAVTAVQINPGGGLATSGIGHISVQSTYDSIFDVLSALVAWTGEAAALRVLRLCTEEGIPVRIYGSPGPSMPMGPQTMQTLPQLLQECETTDRGLLFEPMTGLGIGYRPLYSMYNQDPTVTADYSAAQLGQAFASTADDLLSLNDVTATNLDGSSARQVLLTGTMSVQAPPAGIGRVDTSIQVNAASDGYLAGIASWILHVSTDYHDRFPTIPFNLARAQTPASAALVRVGDMAAVTNPPAWLQPDTIRQLAAGRSETLGPASVWEIDIIGTPAYPYLIAEVDGGGGLATRVDSAGSQVTVPMSPTATSMTVGQTDPTFSPWTTSGGDFPFDVNVGGERMTVTNITGATSPQTFTVTRSVNGVAKSQAAGTAVALWYTPIVGQLTGA